MIDQECCCGVVRSPDGLKGEVSQWELEGETYEQYTTKPTTNANGAAVVVVHDIFGGAIPNTKYIVDHLAQKGFHASMLDLFQGQGWPLSKINMLIARDAEFMTWVQDKLSPAHAEKVTHVLTAYADHLRSQGYSKVGIVGFCYGGRMSGLVSSSGKFDAAVSVHGSSHSDTQILEAKCPIMYIIPEGDKHFPEENIPKMQDVLKEHPEKGEIKIFQGVTHGWVNRGQYDDDEVKRKADEAVADFVAFFSKHLL
jgi:carboxymethylenebutenolidase